MRTFQRSVAHHDVQNLHVGGLHAVAAHAADVPDGLLDVATGQTLAVLEALVLLGHAVGEQARADGGGDLCRAGALRTIADDAAHVAQRIGDVIGRGSTELKARGSYTKEERDMLFCACSKSQAYMVRRVTQEIDKSAFIMVTETNEVFGEGFLEHTK